MDFDDIFGGEGEDNQNEEGADNAGGDLFMFSGMN
jgi:hypothetical protein